MVRGSAGDTHLHQLQRADMCGYLLRIADWISEDQDRTPIWPPRDVVGDMLSFPECGYLPELDGIITTPVFAADGTLVKTPGYNERARLWFEDTGGLAGLAVPKKPSDAEVDEAKNLLLYDMLADFPFKSESGKAYAVAALLVPFVRAMIDGPVPAHLIEAPAPGTGKTLLATAIGVVAMGREPSSQSLPVSRDEVNRTLVAVLREGAQIVLIDNLPTGKTLASDILANALTTTRFEGRLLGYSQMVKAPNRALWLMTGNRPRLSPELNRRVVRIRLDAETDYPEFRSGCFQHEPLIPWVKDERPRLVEACLRLVQAYLAAGRPAYSGRRLGSFEAYCEVVGGVLQHVGIAGFAEDLLTGDYGMQMWEDLIKVWLQQQAGAKLTVKDINVLCEHHGLLGAVRGNGNERSQTTKLGSALCQVVDRRVCGYVLILHETAGNKSNTYSLEKVDDAVV